MSYYAAINSILQENVFCIKAGDSEKYSSSFQQNIPENLTNKTKDDFKKETMNDSNLDPLGNLVVEVSRELLTHKERITLRDLEESERIPAGGGGIRVRLSQIVQLGLLSYMPGAGRRSAFYSLPPKKDIEPKISPLDESLALLVQRKQDLEFLAEETQQEIYRLTKKLEEYKDKIEELSKDATLLTSIRERHANS